MADDVEEKTKPNPTRPRPRPSVTLSGAGAARVVATGPAMAKKESSPDITLLCREMFEKTADYVQSELIATSDDYQLLERMNTSTVEKYEEMKHITSTINKQMKSLNEKYESLQPYLDQIDQIGSSVAQLEQAAYKLDAYSKRLEAKFRQLEKT